MKRINFALLILILLTSLIFASCELKRSNPVDPISHNDINLPPIVTGLTATGSGPGAQNKYVELKWTRNSINTDGYYIYQGLAYNSAFAVVETVGYIPPDLSNTTQSHVLPVSMSGHYYFKISAYKQYPAGRLEGSLSEYKYAYVSN